MKIIRSVLKEINFDLDNEELDFDNSLRKISRWLSVITYHETTCCVVKTGSIKKNSIEIRK